MDSTATPAEPDVTCGSDCECGNPSRVPTLADDLNRILYELATEAFNEGMDAGTSSDNDAYDEGYTFGVKVGYSLAQADAATANINFDFLQAPAISEETCEFCGEAESSWESSCDWGCGCYDDDFWDDGEPESESESDSESEPDSDQQTNLYNLFVGAVPSDGLDVAENFALVAQIFSDVLNTLEALAEAVAETSSWISEIREVANANFNAIADTHNETADGLDEIDRAIADLDSRLAMVEYSTQVLGGLTRACS